MTDIKQLDNVLYRAGFYSLSSELQQGAIDVLLGAVEVLVAHLGDPERGDTGWRGQTAECHMDHADDHIAQAWHGIDGDVENDGAIDHSDGKHEWKHAAARLALYNARLRLVAPKSESTAGIERLDQLVERLGPVDPAPPELDLESAYALFGTEEDNAKAELLSLMHCISEEELFAGWHIGLEFMLWERVLSGNASTLKALSDQAGGWFHWPDGADEPLFVPMSDWLRIYANGEVRL